MPHYATLFRVFDKAKRKKYFISPIDKQALAVARQF
jgi:hypothetical protein